MKRKALIIGIILAPFVGHILWTFTGLGWLYWGSGFLIHLELITWGLLFILFPKAMQRGLVSLVTNEKTEFSIETWSFTLKGILIGVCLFVAGYFGFPSLIHRWIVECGSNVYECLKWYY